MGTLIAIGLILLSAWVGYRGVRLFRARSARPGWWTLLALLFLASAGLGVWLAFFFEYQASHRMRVVSFPLPIVFFVWEEDRWTDFVTPNYYIYPALAANVCTTIGACIAPLFAVFAFLHPRGPHGNHDLPSNHPASGKAGITPPLRNEHTRSGLPEPGRSAGRRTHA